MSKKMWRWCSWQRPSQHVVVKETANQITYDNGVRENKAADSHRWFETWDDMHAWMVENAKNERDSLKRRYEWAQVELDKVLVMTKPEE
jgi:hypothetical protein